MKRGSSARWWSVALILGLLLLIAAFCADAAVHAWVVAHQTPELRHWMLLVSRWGDWPSHVVAGLIGVAVAYFFGRREWLLIFVAMIAACALAGGAARVLKISVGRARPSVSTDAGWNGPRLSSKYHAFPSGHTTSSVAFFTVPCLARRRIAFAFLPIPLLIALSRILLNAHYLSDVVFAAMLGILSALVVWHFIARRYPGAPTNA